MKSPLKRLHETAECLWQCYLSRGPGKTPSSLLDDYLAAQADAVNSLVASRHCDELKEIYSELEKLLRRCVERSEGLCFVTGEAGLIPRKDLHERCDDLIMRLAALCDDVT